MYNRYVPQPDGSFRRNSVTDNSPSSRENTSKKAPPLPPQPKPDIPPAPSPPPRQPTQQSIGSFIKQLLPKGFDTADLLIVLLLILMAGDCEEDQNTALLTLVLYLFL